MKDLPTSEVADLFQNLHLAVGVMGIINIVITGIFFIILTKYIDSKIK